MTVVVRVAAAAFAEAVKGALRQIEPNRPVSGIRTMEQVVDDSVGSRRFPTLLLLAFSLLAVALAAVGISGVVGFSVTQRTREIGIRMALGAQKRDVLVMILRHSL
jgi:putative ABC transport system permease protein